MKKVFLLLMSVTVLISCSKDDIVQEKVVIPEANVWVSQEILNLNNTSDEITPYKYGIVNENNRTKRIYETEIESVKNGVSNSLAGVLRIYDFEYENSRITITGKTQVPYTNSDNKAIYYLDNGRIISKEYFFNSAFTPNIKILYSYNNEGYLTKTQEQPNFLAKEISYSNGNISKIKQGSKVSTMKYSEKRRFPYTDGLNGESLTTLLSGFSHFLENICEATLYDAGYYGVKTNNQISSLEVTDGTEKYSVNFDYVYLPSGQLNEMIQHESRLNWKVKYSFKYN